MATAGIYCLHSQVFCVQRFSCASICGKRRSDLGHRLFRLAVLTLLMKKMSPNDLIAMVISCAIVTAIMIIFHLFLVDTLSIDQKFIIASILAIVGFLIVRRMRDKTLDHRMYYLTIGNVLLGVGIGILLIPLIKWTVERMVFHI